MTGMTRNGAKHILILTADAGFGHRNKAAEAVAMALRETHVDACQVDIVNPLDDGPRAALLLPQQPGRPDRFVATCEDLDLGWNASRAAIPTAGLSGASTVALFNVMRDILRTHRPDAIINTYPLYHPPLAGVFALTGAGRRSTPSSPTSGSSTRCGSPALLPSASSRPRRCASWPSRMA